MKIERHSIDTQTLEEFADEHKLTLLLTTRQAGSHRQPITACFKDCSISDDLTTRFVVGEGDTEAEAVFDYAQKISLQTLFVENGVREDGKRRIQCPVITYDARGKTNVEET